MTRCGRGTVLGYAVARFCNLPFGHRGEHRTVWQGRDWWWAQDPSDGGRGKRPPARRLTRERRGDFQ